MNLSHYVAVPIPLTSHDITITLSSLPHILWQYYLEYLWYYESRSWVARIASVFRVLAVMVAAPIVLLMLLDIASYVIARTLGVIEDAKASTTDTSHPSLNKQNLEPPAILVESCTPPTSDSDIPSMSISTSSSGTDINNTLTNIKPSASNSEPEFQTSENGDENDKQPHHPEAYFASEEHNLRLSGVGVFSPAASQPPSPTLSRKQLQPDGNVLLDDGITLRRRGKGVEGIPE